MLNESGIAALLPTPNTTPAPPMAPTYAPGTVSGGDDRTIFSMTDQINYSAPTESPAMQESIAARPVETVTAAPILITAAPTDPPPRLFGASKFGLYVAIFAIIVFCLMLLLFISTRGKKGRSNQNFNNMPRGYDPYSL